MKFSLSLIILIVLFAFIHSDSILADEDYQLASNNVLKISVYDEDELTQVVRVSTEGTISYPFIGEIYVKGLTVQEATNKIKNLLEQGYLVAPQVSIFVKEYNKIYVLGPVKNPGQYDLKGSLSVVGAISLAGGFTKYAAPNRTRIIRQVNGRKSQIKAPISKILSKKRKWKDIQLSPGDIVLVRESLL